jgi:hypothetical protein
MAAKLEMNLRGRKTLLANLHLHVWIGPKIKRLVNLYPKWQPVLEIPKLDVVVACVLEQAIRQRVADVRVYINEDNSPRRI